MDAKSPAHQRLKKIALSSSWMGMALALSLLGISGWIYPGGNRFDSNARGYSFFGNFLCDLFHESAYNGLPNPGRAYAVLGTYLLAGTLLLFWLRQPIRSVRILGSAAMLVSFLIATPLHDACILTAVPLGLGAFLLSIRELKKSGEAGLAWLGIASVTICTINYLSFVWRVFPHMLPGIQKFALLSFLAWVIASLKRRPLNQDIDFNVKNQTFPPNGRTFF